MTTPTNNNSQQPEAPKPAATETTTAHQRELDIHRPLELAVKMILQDCKTPEDCLAVIGSLTVLYDVAVINYLRAFAGDRLQQIITLSRMLDATFRDRHIKIQLEIQKGTVTKDLDGKPFPQTPKP
jgi:hypothetical protein